MTPAGLDKAVHGHVGVVSPLHAAAVSWFDDSMELRVARQSAQTDQKGVREGLLDAKRTLVGSRIFARITPCISHGASEQHTTAMCGEDHETSLLGIAAAASNPLRMFQVHPKADAAVRKPHSLAAPIASELFSAPRPGQALELLNIDIVRDPVGGSFAVFRVTLRNLDSSASVVFEAGSLFLKSSGLSVIDAQIVGVNVLDNRPSPAASDIEVGNNANLSFVFCAKCIGTLHLSVAREKSQHRV